MKLLFICEGLNTFSIVAQPWKHVIEIARMVKHLGVNVEIISDEPNAVRKSEEILGVPIERVEKEGLLFNIESLSQIMNQKDADVVNWHCSDVWSAIYFWRLRKSIDANIVWTLHSRILSIDDLKNLDLLDYFQLYKFWNNIFNATIPKFLIKKWTSVPLLRHVITLSKSTAKRLKNYGLNDENITPIPSGVDINLFKPSNNTPEEGTILYFGPLSSFRGVDTLLSAFKIMTKRCPSTKLILLARGSNDKSYLLRKAKKLIKVEIIERTLNQKELVDHLNRSCMVVLPFKFWPQVECPLTVIEAMAMKKTVITTFTGAIPETIKNWENGVLVSPKKPEELANIVVKLLNDPSQCEKLGRNARTYVEQFHNWDKIVRDTLDVLTTAAN